MSNKYNIFLLILVFVYFIAVSAGVFYNYNLPNSVGDESVLMSAGLKMIAEKTLRPAFETNYYFPFASYIYLPFIVIILAMSRVFFFSSTAELISFGITDFAKFLPYVRLANIFYGVGCILILYKIAEKMFLSRRVSLIAAFLFSSSLLFVQLSHFARVWVPQIFFILLAFNSIIDYYKKNEVKLTDYLKPIFWTAVAFGTHLVGVLIYFSFLVAHLLRSGNKRVRRIFENKFLLASALLLIIIPVIYWLNPYGFNNYSDQVNQAAVDTGRADFDIVQGLSYYLLILIEFEPLLVLFFLPGSLILYRKKNSFLYIIFSFIIAYYLVIGPLLGSTHAEPRYILPMVPFMVLIAAFGANSIWEKYWDNKLLKIALIACFILICAMPLKMSYLMAKPSTRVQTAEWINGNIPSQSRLLDYDIFFHLNENKETFADIKEYAPYFYTKKRAYLDGLPEEKLPQPNYYVFYPEIFDPVPQEIINKQFDYVILQWWNEDEYNEKMADLAEWGIAPGEPIKTWPENMDIKKERPDIANNMRTPYKYLLTAKDSGPNMAVYRLR